MKKFVLILVFILSNISYSYVEFKNVNIERLNLDFNGCLFANDRIIVYGNGGKILFSDDNGSKWLSKHFLDDTLQIKDIKFINNNLIGITDFDYLIHSKDNGNNWTSVKIGNFEKILSLDVDSSGNTYILKNGLIEFYDFNFKLFNSIKIDTSLGSNEILYNNNSLFLNGINSTLTSLNLKTLELSKIDLSTFGYASNLKIRHIKKLNNSINLLLSTVLLSSNDNGKTWIYRGETSSIYERFNDTMYVIDYDNYDTFKGFRGIIKFYKIDSTKLKKISINNYNRRVTNLFYSDFKMKNEDTIIIVGSQNLIAMSFDKGVNWEIKSFLENTALNSTFISKEIGLASSGENIYHTSNSGITWLPPLFTDPKINKISYFDYFFIDSTGFGYAFKQDNFINDTSVIITNNFFENYEVKFSKDIKGDVYGEYYNTLLKNEGKNIIISPRVNAITSVPYTIINILDNKFDLISKYKIDSMNILMAQVYEGEIIALGRSYSSLNYETSTYIDSWIHLLKSKNNGETWTELLKYEDHDTIPTGRFNIIKNKLYINNYYVRYIVAEKRFISGGYLSRIDLDNPSIEIIRNDADFDYNFIPIINNTAFLQNRKALIYNEDIENTPKKWQKLNNLGELAYFYNYFGNTAYGDMISRTEKNFKLCKITFDYFTDIKEKIEVNSNESYPNPISSGRTLNIKLEESISPELSINLYNSLGNQILIDKGISYNNGTITFKIPEIIVPGLYLVRIDSNGKNIKSIPVIVD